LPIAKSKPFSRLMKSALLRLTGKRLQNNIEMARSL
jgi:hypothetical protein